MELSDALVITGLGMAVVFSGLILTSLLIVSFGVVPRLLAARDETQATAAEAAPAAGAITPAPDDARVVAVIATLLEVERRLHHGEREGRLTLERSPDGPQERPHE